jgi:pSer/pThr/pTyr-binding forkhead associated (FHA) protein
MPTLTIIYSGTKHPVKQEQFIIGRSAKSADLAIKDANISRKHAAVIFHNGAFYMKDLGSTNGIDFGGSPVDSKRIDEGDVFQICGHQLHFTYNA